MSRMLPDTSIARRPWDFELPSYLRVDKIGEDSVN